MFETLLILGAFFFFVSEKENPFFLSIFAILTIWIYLLQPKERRLFRFSFFIATILSVVFFALILPKDSSIYLKLPIFLLIGALFFTIFGLFNTFFAKKRQIYSIVNAVLGIFLIEYGIILAKNNALGLNLIIFTGIMFIFKEYLVLESGDRRLPVELKSKYFREWTMGAVGALLVIESIFFTKTLPLPHFTFLGLISLFFVIIRKIEKDRIKGVLRLNICLEQTLVLVFGIIIALASGRWGR